MMPAPPAAKPAAAPWMTWAALAARLTAGGVLVLAGAAKAGAPAEEFAVVIDAYSILPSSLVPSLAALLPWAELLLGFSLVLGLARRLAAAAGTAFFAVMIAALVSTIVRGIPLADCGCFGFGLHLPPTTTVFIDMTLAAMCAWLWWAEPSAATLDRWIREGQ